MVVWWRSSPHRTCGGDTKASNSVFEIKIHLWDIGVARRCNPGPIDLCGAALGNPGLLGGSVNW